MRKYIYYLCLFMLPVLLVACYEEESTFNVNPIPGITVDVGGSDTLVVYQFDNLVVEPQIDHEGLNETDLTYEWKIDLDPRDVITEILGTERNLNFEVKFPPTINNLHTLSLAITDSNTGLKYITSWLVEVRNNIGEGLVVAVTPDGVNSDIDHIMSPWLTPDYEDVSVKHGVFSSINGSLVEGIIKDMHFTTIYNVDALLAMTNDKVLRVNTLDYNLEGQDETVFYAVSQPYHPQAFGEVLQGDVYIGDNSITSTYLGISNKFGLPFDNTFSVPTEVALSPSDKYSYVLSFYDEVNQHFAYIQGFQSYHDNAAYATPSGAADAPFNPADLPGKINLAAEVYNNRDFLHLLKDEATGEVQLYILDGGDYGVPPAPKGLYDFSAAPDIDNAEFFVILDDQRVVFYATPTKIYAAIYSGATPVFQERYTVAAGEEITTLQIYQQKGFPNEAREYLAANNRTLIMSTYDGTEGKVLLLPFINTGLANIDTDNIQTYTGFDRVTAITPQK